jgi:hypothetical protein
VVIWVKLLVFMMDLDAQIIINHAHNLREMLIHVLFILLMLMDHVRQLPLDQLKVFVQKECVLKHQILLQLILIVNYIIQHV